MVKILLYISGLILAFLFGSLTVVVATPKLGTMAIDSQEDKDVYTIILDKDPEALNLKDGEYRTIKIHYLKKSKK